MRENVKLENAELLEEGKFGFTAGFKWRASNHYRTIWGSTVENFSINNINMELGT